MTHFFKTRTNQQRNDAARAVGQQAEARTCEYLRAAGFLLVTRNYLCRFGEIDLIMKQGHQLVFVEVRYRRSDAWGSGADSVNQTKQRKLIKSALYFLQTNPHYHRFNGRFDVVGVKPSASKSLQFEFNWIKNAFEIQYNC